ncbi:hypothetical protein K493DRAFT_15191 [Basidiobolus meristosporus CBS 931.73]|uniref:Uncharacterized protein n=1 Tax=Basidiobolus meristosporus CBS 931.73 TaxID=1314790 RepID=A0A1Y1YGZ8_9FUNG|nr:hypothetical protein K493DRAFT_15191 [Basidiobolus meristosporus CBS 931.73]|eukprot:ORX97265.1 hypothetical protein K493DRAFT_15191 [Basidiobolus meristosporus CBS 931.73]
MSSPTLSQTPKSSRKLPSEIVQSPLLPCIDEIPDRYIAVPGSVEIDRASYSPRFKDFLRHRIKDGNGTPIRGNVFGSPFRDILSPKSPAPISPACSRRGNRSLESCVTSPLPRFNSSALDIGSPTLNSRQRLVNLGKSPCRFSPFRFISKEHVSPSKRVLVNELRVDPEDKVPSIKLSPPKLKLKEKSVENDKLISFVNQTTHEIREPCKSSSPSKRVLIEEFSQQKASLKKASPTSKEDSDDRVKEVIDSIQREAPEPSSPTPLLSQNFCIPETVESNRDVFLSSLPISLSKKPLDNLENGRQAHVFSPVRKAVLAPQNRIDTEATKAAAAELRESTVANTSTPGTGSSPSKRALDDTSDRSDKSDSPSPRKSQKKAESIEYQYATSAQTLPLPTAANPGSQEPVAKSKSTVQECNSNALAKGSNQIPKFYFPLGKPQESLKMHQTIVRELVIF